MKSLLLMTLMVQLALAQQPQQPQPQQPQRPQAQQPAPTQPQGRQRPSESPRQAGEGAVAETVDETPSVTHHEIRVGGKTLAYTATVAQMPLKNATGETEAHIFYMAYTLDGADPGSRPLTFAFNGGPGSASIWVHMGAMGPRKAKLLDNGDMPPPPYNIVDNENTWLDRTDLVFIDPVGTGYSRAKTAEVARRMNGVQGDLQSVGEFIRMYITRNDRWMSPLFIAGESYGTFRAAGLAGYLIDQGIAFNGIVLISTILNFSTIRPGMSNSLACALHLPSFTADAWYHKKLPADLQQKDLKTVLKEAEAWAMSGYIQALDKGDALAPAERKAVIEKVARYTGLEPRYVDQSEMRIDVAHFTRELLRDKRLTIGRLDGRLTGPSPLNAGETAEFDPSGSLPRPPFQAAFLHYIRSELGYRTDMTYFVSGGIMPWDWGVQNSYADTSNMLRSAFAKNPYLKVLVCQGYYDLATPYFAAEYTFNHMGIHASTHANISWQYYQAGHMMYIDKESHAKLKRDVAEFIRAATQQP
jgi:carboxypeptidase C (cathepsin A)